VALVRFPVGEELWAMQSLTWPKDRFWDEMAASVDATTLHFKDDPVLDAFALPDESHLDYGDAPAFTRALLRALQERGFMTDG
jgi:hypothetical protein